MCTCNVLETMIDVRQVIPKMRHPLLFGIFDMLQPGEGFILVNDHDPRPLHYQFEALRGDLFDWEYQEAGPDLWRIRIGKTA
ncbi:MAG: DUF2249 domain-containing protein [Alsobacter sp.]